MNINSRVSSILSSNFLEDSETGFPAFDLSVLKMPDDFAISIPANLRLGHMVEKIVSDLIKGSNNYDVIHENIQLIEAGKTFGEIDFIVQEMDTKLLSHLELAYKFYLYDPTISEESINNWIGPNRRDSLKEKLEKLKAKQFPLLYHESMKERLAPLDVERINQKLCFLMSLFVPYQYKPNFSPNVQNAIKGYYISYQKFLALDSAGNLYHIPGKKHWGIDPAENSVWQEYDEFNLSLKSYLEQNKAPLCWSKNGCDFKEFFIVWW